MPLMEELERLLKETTNPPVDRPYTDEELKVMLWDPDLSPDAIHSDWKTYVKDGRTVTSHSFYDPKSGYSGIREYPMSTLKVYHEELSFFPDDSRPKRLVERIILPPEQAGERVLEDLAPMVKPAEDPVEESAAQVREEATPVPDDLKAQGLIRKANGKFTISRRRRRARQ